MNARGHKPLLALVAAALLVLVLLAGSACGTQDGTDGAGSDVKTYTDSTYGYSFEYPAGWTLDDNNEAEVSAGASAVAVTGAYDPDGAESDGAFYDLVEVSVYQLNTTIDDSLMPDVKTEVEQTFASLETQDASWKAVDTLTDVTVNGVKGWRVTYDFDMHGVPSRCTFYMLFDGSLEYQLLAQGSIENWEANQPVYDAFVASFTPGSAAASSGATSTTAE